MVPVIKGRKDVIKPSSTTLLFVLAAGLLGSGGGRTADAADLGNGCEAVVNAIQAMSTTPRFHWKMTATTTNRKRPSRHEEVVIDDIVYMTPPGQGKWMRMRMTAADRAAFAAREMEQNPPSECRMEQRQDLGGVEVQTYVYQQNLPQEDSAGAGSGAAVSTSKLWVGASDGLP